MADQPAPPTDLLTLFATGATVGGSPVKVLRAELFDGRVQRFELTEPGDTEEEGGKDLRDRILRVLANSPVPLTRKQIAGLMKRKGIGGRFSNEVSALLETSRIFERDKMLTDDETKYAAGD